jgi:putative transposase
MMAGGARRAIDASLGRKPVGSVGQYRQAPAGGDRTAPLEMQTQMGHTYSSHLYHIIFSTKQRSPFITEDVRDRMFHYICGVAANTGGQILCINGTEDHIHLLTRIRLATPVPTFVGKIKANSSRWVSKTFPHLRAFTWQAGYSSFTVSKSGSPGVLDYILKQAEHHRKMTFEEELAKLLRKHEVEFDPENYLD